MLKSFLVINLIILVCGSSIFASSQLTRTPLPTLTPTPLFAHWSAAEVMRAIKEAGLENQNAHLMRPDEYDPIPALAVQGIYFSIPSVCPDCSGMVLSFNDPAALESTKSFFIETKANDHAALSSWVFERDNILLQLSGQLAETKARQYGAVLSRLQ